MVLTVTLNPAIDKIVFLNAYSIHRLHRIGIGEQSLTLPGGKGVNIAMCLKALGEDVVASGFASGYTGHLLSESLRKRDITTSFLITEGTTRTNVSILDLTNKTLTEINEEGPEIHADDLEFFLDNYKRLLKKCDLVVVGGSLPKGLEDSFYSKLIFYANQAGVKIIMHVSPNYLEAILDEKPNYFIPDLRSKKSLYDKPLNDIDSLIEIGEGILSRNESLEFVVFENRIENVVAVSPKVNFILRPTDLNIVNMLGYADAYVAGFAHGILHKLPPNETLTFASACGLTNVEQLSKDLCEVHKVQDNIQRIKMEVKRAGKGLG